jgi:hypothetical protein
MEKSYRILKLRSGEELIAEIQGEANNKLILSRPMIFKSLIIPDPFGRQKEITILKNWLSHTNEIQTKIPKDFIATYLTPDNDVVELYDLEKEKQDTDSNPKRKIIDVKKDNQFPKEPRKMDDMTPEELNDFLTKVKQELNENPDAFEDDQMMMPPDMQNFITMSIFLPPEALLSLVDAGLLDVEDVNSLIDSLRDNNHHNDNYKGDDEKRQSEEDFGMDWKDWSPNPEDYLK